MQQRDLRGGQILGGRWAFMLGERDDSWPARTGTMAFREGLGGGKGGGLRRKLFSGGKQEGGGHKGETQGKNIKQEK